MLDILSAGYTISHPLRDRDPFILNVAQTILLQKFRQNCNTIINKSRQLGVTTILNFYALEKVLNEQNYQVVVVTQNRAKKYFSTNLLQTYSDILLRQLVENNLEVEVIHDAGAERIYAPAFPKIKTEDGCSVTFSNDSTITVIGGNEHLLGLNIDLLIIDEATHDDSNFQLKCNEFFAQVKPSGQTIISGTPRRKEDRFWQLWLKAKLGNINFQPIVLPWYVLDDRDDNWFKNQTRLMSPNAIKTELLCQAL